MDYLNVAICHTILGMNCVGTLYRLNDMDVLDNGDVVLFGHFVDGGERMHTTLETFLDDNPCYREVIA